MGKLAPLLTALFMALTAGSRPQAPSALPECTDISASLAATPPEVGRGHKPEFALTLSTTSASPVRMLDVRHGRRPDLQDNYFEVVVLQRGRVIETPIAILGPWSGLGQRLLCPASRRTNYPAASQLLKGSGRPSSRRVRGSGSRLARSNGAADDAVPLQGSALHGSERSG